MFNNLVIALFTMALSLSAVAQTADKSGHANHGGDHVTEFVWQPAEGQSAVQARFNYGFATVEIQSSAGTKVSTSATKATGLSAEYHYGLSDHNSVGVHVPLLMNNTSTDTPVSGSVSEAKTSGMGDITILSRNHAEMGGFHLLYGVGLGFSGGKYKAAATGVDGNNYSGGLSLPLYVGAQFALKERSYAGVKLDYGMKMERTRDTTPESRLTGGNTMSLLGFYECQKDSIWNAYLGFGSTGVTTISTGGEIKATSSLNFGGSWGKNLTPGMLLAVHYDGSSTAAADISSTLKHPSYLTSTIGVRGRWSF